MKITLPPEAMAAFKDIKPQLSAAPGYDAVVEMPNPGEAIANAGQMISEEYARFQYLRDLLQRLNGAAADSPPPASVRIERIDIHYAVAAPNEDDSVRTATVTSVVRTGDLFNLLNRDAEQLVDRLRQLAGQARENAELIEASCARAVYSANAKQSPVSP